MAASSSQATTAKARKRKAALYLEQVLIPLVEQGDLQDLPTDMLEETLRRSWQAFRQTHPGSGADFDLIQVEGLLQDKILRLTAQRPIGAAHSEGTPISLAQSYLDALSILHQTEPDRICYGWDPNPRNTQDL
jgi:hypothetical protein